MLPDLVFFTRPEFFFTRPQLRFWKITIVLFVDVALRAASILENLIFLYLLSVLEVSKPCYLVGFEHREYARTLSFEKICRMH